MNDALSDNCPGLTSRPLPLGDVFQTATVYPVLDRSTDGIVTWVPMVFPLMPLGSCPVPELISKENEYSFAIHFG